MFVAWLHRLNLRPVPCLLFAESGPELSEGNDDEMKTFNEDIVCCHGDVPSSSANQLYRKVSAQLYGAQAAYMCLMYSTCRGSQYPRDRAETDFSWGLGKAEGVLS